MRNFNAQTQTAHLLKAWRGSAQGKRRILMRPQLTVELLELHVSQHLSPLQSTSRTSYEPGHSRGFFHTALPLSSSLALIENLLLMEMASKLQHPCMKF